jgi:hypothetical protein
VESDSGESSENGINSVGSHASGSLNQTSIDAIPNATEETPGIRFWSIGKGGFHMEDFDRQMGEAAISEWFTRGAIIAINVEMADC